MSEAVPAFIPRRGFVKRCRQALILQRFSHRRIWPRNRFRAIFCELKRISEQKQMLGWIFGSLWIAQLRKLLYSLQYGAADDRGHCAAPRRIAGLVRSDLDFLVEFDSGAPEALSLKTYLGLKDALETLFGRKVDLVEPGAKRNPYLKADVERSRKPVFAA